MTIAAIFRRALTALMKKKTNIALCSAFAVILAITAGCAGPLAIKYNPKPPENKVRLKQPVRIAVKELADNRPTAEKSQRKIGKIAEGILVSDMSEREIMLSEDVSKIVADAFVKELTMAGFTVAETKTADFIIDGEITQFKLDIGARDEIFVEVTPKILDAKSGKAIWSETETVKEDRFAGAFGNSRASISSYITSMLSKAIRRAISEATPILTGQQAIASVGEAAQTTAKGRLIITTDPPRAKVYLNGVYYGLTPLNSDVDDGVYDLTLRLTGFKDGKEKLSVRKGEVTEMEVKFKKE